jgi:glycosyltransferase involved in cell wall biosynthesis
MKPYQSRYFTLGGGYMVQRAKKIGLDITQLVHARKFAGVERADTQFHKHLFRALDSKSYELVPIYTRNGSLSEIVLHPKIAPDEIFSKSVSDISDCDVIILAFLNASIPINRIRELKKQKDLQVVSVIHDIMPIKNPEWFFTPTNPMATGPLIQNRTLFQLYLQMSLSVADIVIVNSQQVKSDIEKLGWNYSAQLKVVPLGTFEKPLGETRMESQDRISCLYVSTVEPRKAHLQLIEAFDNIWAKGIDVHLNIVGNEGWLVDDLIRVILNHPEFNKRLFWHKGLSDEAVNQIYKASQIAFAVSFDEGFGLNLEEGLAHGLKVIARDIPVFRERTYDNLYFFEGGAYELSAKIIEVLGLPTKYSEKSNVRTMEDYTLDIIQLLDLL